MTGEHITTDQMAAALLGEPEGEAKQHLAECPTCLRRLDSLRAFSDELDNAWNAAAIESAGLAHPSSAAIEKLWLGELADDAQSLVQTHVSGCRDCSAHLARLEEGTEYLMQTDPLKEGIAWSERVPRRFAAAVQVGVEAARGSFITAGSMIRDVMTPQAHTRLAPAPAIAMGGRQETPERDEGPWSGATFQTDEISGDITGSTDQATGRGILRVVINKAPVYAGKPPLVDLIKPDGQPVTSQHALDAGDRYVATFEGIDQGSYLLGIHEPND